MILWCSLWVILGDYRVDLGLYGEYFCDWILGLSLISGLGEMGVNFRVILRDLGLGRADALGLVGYRVIEDNG